MPNRWPPPEAATAASGSPARWIVATGRYVCDNEGLGHCSRSQSLIVASAPPETKLSSVRLASDDDDPRTSAHILPSNLSRANAVTPAWCAQSEPSPESAASTAVVLLLPSRTTGRAARSPPSNRKRIAERKDFRSFSVWIRAKTLGLMFPVDRSNRSRFIHWCLEARVDHTKKKQYAVWKCAKGGFFVWWNGG